nr:MAG TPA: hypothetical protein [Caudoviricetes sp.]
MINQLNMVKKREKYIEVQKLLISVVEITVVVNGA